LELRHIKNCDVACWHEPDQPSRLAMFDIARK